MMENIIAAVILVLAVAGIAGLVAYRMHKSNKNLTIDEFLEAHYSNLVSALQDVVSLLLINIDQFEDKESYEKAIISTTIDKLEENCMEFGIDSSLLNLFNRDTLTEMLYNLLHKEEVTVFTNTVPQLVMEAKPELYDTAVVEAVHTDTEYD